MTTAAVAKIAIPGKSSRSGGRARFVYGLFAVLPLLSAAATDAPIQCAVQRSGSSPVAGDSIVACTISSVHVLPESLAYVLVGGKAYVSAAQRGQLGRILIAVADRGAEAWKNPVHVVRKTSSLATVTTGLDFDAFADGSPVSGLPNLQVTNAAVFSSGVSLNELEFPPHSSPNVAVDAGGPVSIAVSQTAYSFGAYVTYRSTVVMRAFDSNGRLAGSASSKYGNNLALSGAPGSSPNEFLQVQSASPIARVTVTGDPAGLSFAMDDLTLSNVPPSPALTSVAPSAGQTGRSLVSIAITGAFTHFLQGSTTASFGAGITVNSLTVNSPTSATANITISPSATPGSQSVTLTTGSEVATLLNGFIITAPVNGLPNLTWLGGGHTGGVRAVGTSADGTVWSAGGDGTMKQWNAANMGMLRTLAGVQQNAAGFAGTGQHALILGPGAVQAINLADGSVTRSFGVGDLGSGAYMPTISANGQTVAFGRSNWGSDALVFANGQGPERTFGASSYDSAGYWFGGVSTLAVSADGQYVAACLSVDYQTPGTIRLYRVSDGTLLRLLTHNTTGVLSLAFSPDGTSLASSTSDGKLNVLRLSDLVVTSSVTVFESGSPLGAAALAFSPDGTQIAQVDSAAARIYHLPDGASVGKIPGAARSVTFTPDGQWLVVGGAKDVRLWLLATLAPLPTVPPHSGSISAVAYSPRGDLVASAAADLTVKLRSAVDGTLVASLTGHTDAVTALAFSPDGDMLATASADHTIRVWRTSNFALITTLTGHTQGVRALVFSPDGSLLATGSASPEQVVKLWAVGGTWTNTSTLTGVGGGVSSLQFAPDGQTLAGASDGGIVRLWQVSTGSLSRTYLAPSQGTMSIAFSPDGQLLVAGWGQNILVFQGSQTGPVVTVPAHSKSGTSLAYSPDGLRVVTGNPDGTLKVWNPAGWGLVSTYTLETNAGGGGVTSVAYAPDGTRFVYGRGDATIGVVGTGVAALPATVTVTTNPPGLAMTVDGTVYTGPHTFTWTPGATHSVSVASPQGSNGTRQVFTGWSDGGAAGHTVAPMQSRVYTANFLTQYLLTSSLSPAASGTLTIAPTSADGYYAAGTVVQLTEAPAQGFVFSTWSGDASGTRNSVSVAMTQPRTVAAAFSGTAMSDIAVAMSSSATQVNSGRALGFTVTVTNLGPATSGSMTLIVNLPAGFSFLSASSSRGSCTGTVQISCVLGTIDPSGIVTAAVNVTPFATGTISMTASVNGGTADPNPSNNSATVSVVVLPAGLPPVLWMSGSILPGSNEVIRTTTDGLIWVAGLYEVGQYRASDLRLLHTVAPDFAYVNGGFDATLDGKYYAYSIAAPLSGGPSAVKVERADGSLVGSFAQTAQSFGGWPTPGRVSLSADGKFLSFVNGGRQYTQLYSVSDGANLGQPTSDGFSVLSPDGTILASEFDSAVHLYAAPSFTLYRTLTGLNFYSAQLSFSADGTLLMAATPNQIVIWQLADLLVLQNFTFSGDSQYSATLSPDGQFVAHGTPSAARVWRVSDGSLVTSIVADCYDGIAFTPDNLSLICGGRQLKMFGLPQGVPSQYQTGNTNNLDVIAYSGTGNRVAVAGADSIISLRNTSDGNVLSQISWTGNNPITGLAYSPDGTKLAAGIDNKVTVWNTTGLTVAANLSSHTQPVTAVAFSPDGTLLASASAAPEQTVKIWSTQTWALVRTLIGASGGLVSVQFSHDGTKVVAAASDGIAREWNLTTGSVVKSYLAPSQGNMRLRYSPDGTKVAAGWTSKVLIFNSGTSTPVLTLNAHSKDNTAVDWSPDGTRLVSTNPDGTVDVWDTSSWAQLSQYNAETYPQYGGVLSVAYSPDGSQFSYGRADGVLVAVDTGFAPSGTLTTVTTNPPGLNIVVDGTTTASPQTFRWQAGSTHTIGAPAPQGSSGTRNQFSFWSDAGTQTHTITTPATPATYTAQFNSQYLLTPAVTPGAAGSVLLTPTSPDGYYDAGTVVQAVATANVGYVFGSWSGDAAGTANPASVTMSAPRSLTANYSSLPLTVVTTNPPGLAITVDGAPYVSPQSFNWTAGTSHSVSLAGQQGARGLRYAFNNWVDGGTMSRTITAPSGSTTYTANFNTQYPLATNSNPAAGGTVSANPSATDAYYNAGSSVQLTATAASGYRFTNWSGDISGTAAQQTVAMGASRSVTANFTAVSTPVLTFGAAVDAASVGAGTPIGFTLQVSNSGVSGTGAATAVTMSSALPAGSGILWSISPVYTGPGTCAITGAAGSQVLNCSLGDLAAGASASVHLASATSTAGCAAYSLTASLAATNNSTLQANASTTVLCPSLTIVKSHSGSFTQGQTGATYSVVVSNGTPAGPTSGTVTVTETVPAGLTLVSMSGTGWTCPGGGTTCTRSDALAAGGSYPAITVTVNVAANATSPRVNQVSVSGGGSAGASTTDSTVIGGLTAVTVTTTPTGLAVVVDGTTLTAPQSFNWAPGSSHTVAVTSPQGSGGSRAVFASWSDTLPQSHTITAPSTTTTYTANFTTQYLLTLNVAPAASGFLVPTPPSSGGYFDAGTTVSVLATPSGSNGFWLYTGDLTGRVNPQTVTMTAPHTVTANFAEPPVAASVTPASGTGATQTFTGVYTTPKGYADLQWVQMLFAVATDGGGQAYCFVHYDVQGNSLWLYGDGGFFIGPVTPGTASNRLQNSFCALNTAGSTVIGAGNTLTLNANVTYKQGGARNIYMRAMNQGQADTGWASKGTWTPAAATQGALSVSPSSGSGSTQTFTMTYPDPPGFAGSAFGWTQFLVAAASDGGGQPFCFVHYDRGGNGLWMYSSDVGFFLGPVAPGTASNALSSSACSVNTAASTVSNTGGNLVVNVPVTMKAPMSGAKKIFQRTLDTLNRDTGWQQTGTWTVQ